MYRGSFLLLTVTFLVVLFATVGEARDTTAPAQTPSANSCLNAMVPAASEPELLRAEVYRGGDGWGVGWSVTFREIQHFNIVATEMRVVTVRDGASATRVFTSNAEVSNILQSARPERSVEIIETPGLVVPVHGRSVTVEHRLNEQKLTPDLRIGYRVGRDRWNGHMTLDVLIGDSRLQQPSVLLRPE